MYMDKRERERESENLLEDSRKRTSRERDHDVMLNDRESKGKRYVQAGRRNNL